MLKVGELSVVRPGTGRAAASGQRVEVNVVEASHQTVGFLANRAGV